MRFTGKTAFITGGGTGIGAEIAKRIVSEGGKVVLMGRRAAPLEEVADPLNKNGQHAIVVTGDAADQKNVQHAVAQAKQVFGSIDVLVANAGGHGLGYVDETDDASWELSLRLNLTTAFNCARECLPELKQRKGNIVIVSSIAGLFAGPGVAGYVTTKHALIGLTRSLARDYGVHGVRANAVCPGWVRTAMADEQMKVLVEMHKLKDVAAAYKLVTKDVPLQRPAEPEEVANLVAFLASHEASMMSGSVITVDGGSSAVDLPTLAFVG